MKPYNFVDADGLEGQNKRPRVAEDSLCGKCTSYVLLIHIPNLLCKPVLVETIRKLL